MITLFLHLIILYLLPWIFLGMIVIGVIWVLASDAYDRRLENYIHEHTGWRPDRDE